MTNSFNIVIDEYTARSTDDYHIMAEIVRNSDGVVILQWYREEVGFSFKFLENIPLDKPEEIKTIVKLFYILVKIVDFFMLDDSTGMKVILGKDMQNFPMLRKMLTFSGVKFEGHFENENYDGPLDDGDKRELDNLNDSGYYDQRRRSEDDEEDDEDFYYDPLDEEWYYKGFDDEDPTKGT